MEEKKIVVQLSDEDLRNINGGLSVNRLIEDYNLNISISAANLASPVDFTLVGPAYNSAGKNESGGNGDIFGKPPVK